MRSLFVIALAGCAAGSSQLIADGTNVSVYSVREPAGHHPHPLRVSDKQVRAALLQDGNLVDAQISSVAGPCANALGRLASDEELELRVSGADYRMYGEANALVIVRRGSGATTRYALAAPPPAIEIIAPTAGEAHSSDESRARAIYQSAMAHYNLGEIKEALESFREAYRLVREPALLFNIAQCHRRLGQHAQAAEFYRSYRREVPDSPNRAEVERLIGEMERGGK
jgi:tetratricopeptide (TPR) repeat protein